MRVDRFQTVLRALAATSALVLGGAIQPAKAATAVPPAYAAAPPRPFAEHARAWRVDPSADLAAPVRPAIAPFQHDRARAASPAFTSRSHARGGGALARRVQHGRRRGSRGRSPPGPRPSGRRRAGRGPRLAPRSHSSDRRAAPDRLGSGRAPRAHRGRVHLGPVQRRTALRARHVKTYHRTRRLHPISSGRCRSRAARGRGRRRPPRRSRARRRAPRGRRRRGRRPRAVPELDADGPRPHARSSRSALNGLEPPLARGRVCARSPFDRSPIDPRAEVGAGSRRGVEPAFTRGACE